MIPLLKEIATPETKDHGALTGQPFLADPVNLETMMAANDTQASARRPLLERRRKRWTRRAAH